MLNFHPHSLLEDVYIDLNKPRSSSREEGMTIYNSAQVQQLSLSPSPPYSFLRYYFSAILCPQRPHSQGSTLLRRHLTTPNALPWPTPPAHAFIHHASLTVTVTRPGRPHLRQRAIRHFLTPTTTRSVFLLPQLPLASFKSPQPPAIFPNALEFRACSFWLQRPRCLPMPNSHSATTQGVSLHL